VGRFVSVASLKAFRGWAERRSPLPGPAPTSFWIRQLQDRAPAFRQQAIQALELIGPKEEAVVPALAGMLKDRNTGVRVGTAVALRRIGPAPVRQSPSSSLHCTMRTSMCALMLFAP